MEKKFGKRGKKQKKASIVKHCDPEIPPSSLIFAINADGFSQFPSLTLTFSTSYLDVLTFSPNMCHSEESQL